MHKLLREKVLEDVVDALFEVNFAKQQQTLESLVWFNVVIPHVNGVAVKHGHPHVGDWRYKTPVEKRYARFVYHLLGEHGSHSRAPNHTIFGSTRNHLVG